MARPYSDIPGFCKGSTIEEIREHGHVLTPGRYVGAPEAEEDGEPFEEKLARLIEELNEQTRQARMLDDAIAQKLKGLANGA